MGFPGRHHLTDAVTTPDVRPVEEDADLRSCFLWTSPRRPAYSLADFTLCPFAGIHLGCEGNYSLRPES